ncbi:MAG: hypothetical protein E7509_00930 [Ruminococcus sp.]|nr:hypothetical protein [Ruminococcus sp.]
MFIAKEIKKQKKISLFKNVPVLAFVMLISVFSAQCRVSGYLSFVNVLIASLSGIWGVFSFVASAVTYIFTDSLKEGFVQLGGMTILLGVRLVSNRKENRIFEGLITAFSLIICTLVSSAVERTSSQLFVYRMVSSVLCGCVVYFSFGIKKRLVNDGKISLYGIDGIVVSLIYMLLITTLCNAQLYTMNVGRMLGVFATFLFAKKYRISGGGICGALTCFATLLCSPSLAYNTLVLSTAGIIGGLVAVMGKIPMIAGFVMTSVFGLVVGGINDDTFMIMTDIAVATVLFVVLPQNSEEALLSVFSRRKIKSDKASKVVSDRVNFASMAMSDVKDRISSISKELDKHDKNYNDNSKQLRELLCEQLSATKCLLDDISRDTKDFEKFDSELTEKARIIFGKYNIPAEGICVYNDANDNLYVEAYKQGKLTCDVMKLTVDLSMALEVELSMPNTVYLNGITKMTFSKASLYKIISGAKQIASSDKDFCGDTLDRVWITSSKYMIILSDGMGTGKRAKLDSSFAVDLITRFTACGISPITALKFINSILRVKGWDESFATADIALFDTCGGYVKFVKSGAHASYIARDGSLIKVESKAFPLGILPCVSPSENEYKIFDGDMVIVASDGVNEKAIRKALNEIRKNELKPNQIAELICGYVKEYSTDVKTDDISVCVSLVSEA